MRQRQDTRPTALAPGREAPEGLRWQRRDARLLTLVFLAFPLWWVLGLTALAPILLAVWLAWSMAHQPERIRLPGGSTWWLLFLVWVLLGVFVLWVNAPLAQPGGGFGRLLVFALQLVWYLAATSILLWIANTSRTEVPDRLLWLAFGSLFVVTTAGGVLGVVAPGLEFRSAIEYVLPGGLRANEFVRSLVHPQVSDVQTVLGRAEPRPKAPFPYSNTWGSVMALSLVFGAAALVQARRRARLLGIAVLLVASVPIVYSLNRGLWACLGLGAIGVMILAVVRHRNAATMGALAVAVLAAVVLALGPLGTLVQERLDHQHSNDRRGQLLSTTVESMSQGSPVVGFGSTRNVQGSFASISGGATPTCPACGVPPLGTQGHIWLVLFAQGWVGTLFFLTFILMALARSWRCRTANEAVATFVLVFFCVQMWIYDTIGIPLILVMAAIAMAWRERAGDPGLQPSTTQPWSLPWTLPQLGDRIRRGAPLVLVLALVGAGLGWVLAPGRQHPQYLAEARIVLVPAPTYLDPGLAAGTDAPEAVQRAKPVTIDTEAALVLSQSSLTRALGSGDTRRLRDSISISAEPTTDILVIGVTSADPALARTQVSQVADSYLLARRKYLAQRRADLVDALRTDLAGLDSRDPATIPARATLTTAIGNLQQTATDVGRVVRTTAPKPTGANLAVPMTSGFALGGLFGVLLGFLGRLFPMLPRKLRRIRANAYPGVRHEAP